MYLGIDCGTQGTKALVIDAHGDAFGRGYAPHQLIERANGAREQEPQWWVDALRIAVKSIPAEERAKVRAIGVSGQQHGLVVLDEDKQVIRPAKLWNDTETAPQNAEMVRRLGGPEAWFQRFGVVPLTGYTLSKLLWLKEREPENFDRIRHILLPHEYLNFWLTGTMAAEYGDASGTAYFDVRTRSWAPEVLAAIDGGTGHLLRALPQLIGPEEPVGTVRAEVAEELGLPADCMVAPGGGDNMMGAIGTGNVREGVVTLSLGTSSTVYSFSSQPVLDETGNVAPFCSSTGGWLPLVCTMNATNVVTQTVKLLGKTVEEIDPALEATIPGAGGVTFLPFLNGERTPDLPQATGTIAGINASNFTAANLIRAAVEGVSFGILNGLELMQRGKAVEMIFVIGGGSRSAQWRQLLADATGATIRVPVEEEAGALGGAMQAIFVDGQQTGKPQSYAEIAERVVRFRTDSETKPREAQRSAYENAMGQYRRRLAELYGVHLHAE